MLSAEHGHLELVLKVAVPAGALAILGSLGEWRRRCLDEAEPATPSVDERLA